MRKESTNRLATLTACCAMFACATTTQAQNPAPSFSKTFSPDVIGPGSVSTLMYVIENLGPMAVEDMGFSETFPEGLTVATPVNVTATCGGMVEAFDGGNAIVLIDGAVSPGGSCWTAVDVMSSALGTHQTVSSPLTTSVGDSTPATADLTVDPGRPGFSKSFMPETVPYGGRSTLAFAIDNTANPAGAIMPTFVDQLPPGMLIADPSNASTDCGSGLITALPGGSVITYESVFTPEPAVGAGESCNVFVDVRGNSTGALTNVSGALTTLDPQYQEISSGKASAVLQGRSTRSPWSSGSLAIQCRRAVRSR